ncbi:MAG: hypothetical protein R3343_12995 [Nitriliruptorales bacterium]|nr:hypothetical protein [Nitriliruptorales bacterium]
MRPISGNTVAERGSAAIELVAGVGLLVFPAVLLVLSLPTWAQARTAAEVAAREAARTVVLADDPMGPAATAAGRAAAETVLANHGRRLVGEPTFEWDRVDAAGGRVRQDQVAATVTIRMPAVAVPFVGSWAAFDWSTTHVEPLDIYRSVP